MNGLLKTDEIESRAYQEVIAASSITNNTLVVLPTGLGKTVIAAMIAANRAENGKVLFLAPTKPLVNQHKRSFNKFIDLDKSDMQVMNGDISPNQRYKAWKEKKIFFATPQVVENDLIADEVPVEDFSLIIFDEAHRATGDYSYVFISSKMPNVQKLALTASPGGDKEAILDVADNLGIDNFEVRTEEDPDVKPYIQDREVDWRRVSLDDRFKKAKQGMEQAYNKELSKLKKLGMLDSTANVHKGQLLKLQGKLGSQVSQKQEPKYYKAISHVACAIKISQAMELLESQGVSQCYDYMKRLENDDSKAASRALSHEGMQHAKSMVEYLKKEGVEHPKLGELRDLLGDMEDGEKAIVFTEYRASADNIVEQLNQEGLRATKFIGQQGDEGMSQTEQIEVLQEFDQDEHNVLVSTSIGEEGLDVPAVDYVVFYEPVASGIRDIQRAGRTGRQESGRVVVLIAENTRDEGQYWSAYHKKQKMNRVLQELKEDDAAKNQPTLDDFGSDDADEEDKEEETRIEVIADDRENSVAKELSKMDIIVNKKRLDVADFQVSDRAAVERKSASDFVDSIVDNRLFDQLNEIRQFSRPVIIIEGKELFSHRKVHPNAIRGALASITLDYGIPILWSEDENETAELLRMMAKREQEEEDRDIAVRGQKSAKSNTELQEFVVAGLPDVNTKLAERLLEEFGTVEKIFTATEEELMNVRGLGEKKARKIKALLTSEYGG